MQDPAERFVDWIPRKTLTSSWNLQDWSLRSWEVGPCLRGVDRSNIGIFSVMREKREPGTSTLGSVLQLVATSIRESREENRERASGSQEGASGL